MIIEVCTQGALPGGVVVFFWRHLRLGNQNHAVQ